MKLNNIDLSSFDKIIFDMDGVITSEYMYWDAAAFTAYELLLSNKFYGSYEIDSAYCMNNISKIHNAVLLNDKITREVKAKGVNTNWDLAYLVICISLYVDPNIKKIDEAHFTKVLNCLKELNFNAPEIYEKAEELAKKSMGISNDSFKRGNGKLWNEMQLSFQHWFLGTELYKKIYGTPLTADFRDGLVTLEKPVIKLEKIQSTLKKLYQSGITLGIGTGRPQAEIEKPLELWDIRKYFDENSIVTYTDVTEAEENLELDYSLAKPNPFVFLKAAFGDSLNDMDIIRKKYDSELCRRILIVGDAPSDFLAAKAADFKFAAVLTGVSGKKAEKYFLENKADYILNDVSELVI